jgi:predicted XRE-type DNA-binding protein
MTHTVEFGQAVVEYVIDSNSCWNCINRYVGNRLSDYPKVHLSGKHYSIHRCMYQRVKLGGEPIPEGLVIRHSCDNRRCINPEHLLAGTVKDNAEDMVNRGRSLKGERNVRNKITEEQVKEIKRLYFKEKLSQGKIEKQFGIKQSAISKIVTKRTWKHI